MRDMYRYPGLRLWRFGTRSAVSTHLRRTVPASAEAARSLKRIPGSQCLSTRSSGTREGREERGSSGTNARITWREVVEYGLKGLAVFLLSSAVWEEIIVPWYRAYQRKKQFDLVTQNLQASQKSVRSFSSAKCSTQDLENSGPRSQRYNFIAEAVEKAAPSVVYIEKSQTMSTIFGPQMVLSSGSGFIVSEDGYVLTNAHVVGGARSVKVKLASGKMVKGEITHIDQVSDLALLKLSVEEPLPALKFGPSSSLRPGEWVVAMGSPLALSNTITAGIVSSVQRPSKELGLHRHGNMQYIQTDAPITVGNSGGPLVNLDGEVIGVNTLTAGPGISFAIPSDFAKNFVANANKTARLEDKYAIGISMLTITPDICQALQQRGVIPSGVSHGVFVAQVWSSSVAAQAGLKRGDVIVVVNGKPVTSSRHVFNMVQSGKRLTMEIVRNSERKNILLVPEKL